MILKEQINVLFLRDTINLLDNESLKYIVIENNDDFFIKEVPIVLHDSLKTLYNNFAYDYDELSLENKKKYKLEYKKYVKNGDNTYKLETKEYKKNNHKDYFPKQKLLNK